jgi:tryptophan halogenase
MNKNIIILGGGTAGWLSALLVKQFYPDENVTLIESDEIGILGAGEGTVPNFIEILDILNIPVSDLVKECDATIKVGIRFKNWNGDGKDYFHEFGAGQGLDHKEINYNQTYPNLSNLIQIAKGLPLDDLKFIRKLVDKNKVPFSKIVNYNFPNATNPIFKVEHLGNYALHFNARLLATYLKKLALSRNINRVEGKLASVERLDNGDINKLVLENKKEVLSDFVFDCSGFARLLIGKTFNTKWIDYKQHLPLDTALPFFIPHDAKDIAPETEAIAMKYGWVWKIPVGNRYGCGYVFDSKYIDQDAALQEVEEYFGHSITSPKTFKFKAGTFENTVVNNCMAVGLAQSFVEPLEATSIMISCINLLEFLQNDGVYNESEIFKNYFNKECLDRNSEVVNFLYLHYLTKRDDSPFWKEFRNKTTAPSLVTEKLNRWKESPVGTLRYEGHRMFGTDNWLQVADGIGLLDQQSHIDRVIHLKLLDKIGSQMTILDINQQMTINSCLDHFEFLNFLKQD